MEALSGLWQVEGPWTGFRVCVCICIGACTGVSITWTCIVSSALNHGSVAVARSLKPGPGLWLCVNADKSGPFKLGSSMERIVMVMPSSLRRSCWSNTSRKAYR